MRHGVVHCYLFAPFPLFLAMLGDEVLACSLRDSFAVVFFFSGFGVLLSFRELVGQCWDLCESCVFSRLPPTHFPELLFYCQYLLTPRLWCNNRIERIVAATHEYLVLIRPAKHEEKNKRRKKSN
jgi:hypothetical protein